MNGSRPTVKKVLVVEDEPVISRVCQRVLTAEGYEVQIAANGRLAQEMLSKEQYDLFLVDIRTPEMNGKELYHYMKERYPETRDMVVFTTGDVTAKDIRSFLEESGRPFLPKPFSPDELRSVIKNAVGEIER